MLKNIKNKGSNEDCFNCWMWDQRNPIILELIKGDSLEGSDDSLEGSDDTPMFNPHKFPLTVKVFFYSNLVFEIFKAQKHALENV